MKTSFVILLLLVLFSCSEPNSQQETGAVNNSATNKNSTVLKTDEYVKAGEFFVSYTSGEIIRFRDQMLPLNREINSITKRSTKKKNKSALKWEMVKLESSDSPDVGYTVEKWNYTTQTDHGNDTIISGGFITVWKKQPDGSWKHLQDGGNPNPQVRSIAP